MEYQLEEKRVVAMTDRHQEVGEMTWSNAGESLLIIDHTFVEEAYRGQGVAEKLVSLGVNYARNNNKKVIPLCPFAKEEFVRNEAYQDVLNG